MGNFGKKVILAIPFAVFGADGIIKHYVEKKEEFDVPREAFSGRLWLRRHYNRGAAFGIGAGKPAFVTAVQGVLLSVSAACFAALLPKRGRIGLKAALGLILGGGASNFYDRLKRKHVVDYVSIPARWNFARRIVFNLSDVCILCGSLLLAVFGRKGK